ncbi:MAG TPA: O-methyltransferase [Candidatus Limnocylindrales bacterium]|nr:O-methyltransferase [Candidatus Limnocylindrales bacterium]
MSSDRRWFAGEAELDFIESIARSLHPVLAELEAAAEPDGVPIVSRQSGRVLAAVASDRRRIVEVGTAIGYSTLWLALGQPGDGTIVTVDPNDARTSIARDHWRRAGIPDGRISVVSAKALDAFRRLEPALAGPFDLAFIDAVKEEYSAYLDELLPRLVPGALVVADNVLWSGRTSGAAPSRPGDGTAELRAFCTRVLGDPRFTGTILPVGDGILLAAYRP